MVIWEVYEQATDAHLGSVATKQTESLTWAKSRAALKYNVSSRAIYLIVSKDGEQPVKQVLWDVLVGPHKVHAGTISAPEGMSEVEVRGVAMKKCKLPYSQAFEVVRVQQKRKRMVRPARSRYAPDV